MKRAAFLLAWVVLASLVVSRPVYAGGAVGKVVSAEEDKVTVQLEEGKAAGFPVGTRDVELKKDGAVVVSGRIMSVNGDKVTLAVIKGKYTDLPAGTSVEVEQSRMPEKVDGC